MIIGFDTSTLSIRTILAGSDPTAFSEIDSIKPAGTSVQIIADDADVINNRTNMQLFIAVVAGPTLTAVIRRYVVTLTASANPINMNQQPTISVQLKDQLGVNVSQVETVTLSVDLGTLANATIITNGSGFASTTYKPHKGSSGVIIAAVATFLPGQLVIAINIPTTPAAQNWLESNDVKISAITTDKIASGAVTGDKLGAGINVPPLPRLGLPASLALDANALYVDATNVFVNGFVGPGATNPVVRKITMFGSITGSRAYVPNNLTSGLDGMDGDATDIWVAAGNHLLQINKGTMAVTNDYTVDPSGTIQSVTLDAASSAVWCFLRGGTTNPDKLLRINNGTGNVDAVIDLDTGVGAVIDRKRGIIYGGDIYFNVDTTSLVASWTVVNRVTNATTPFGGFFGVPSALNAIAANGEGIWIGGVDGLSLVPDVKYPTPSLGGITADVATVGIIYDLLFDGVRVWAITSELGAGDITPRYIRELFVQVGYNATDDAQTAILGLGRVIDAGPNDGFNPVLSIPNFLAVDANNLYASNFRTTAPVGNSKENVIKFKYQ